MMKPQSLQLHSVKDGFGRRRFGDAGQGCARLGEKLFAYQRVRIASITGIPPIKDNFSGLGETFSGRQAVGFLTLINGSQRREQIPKITTRARRTKENSDQWPKPAYFTHPRKWYGVKSNFRVTTKSRYLYERLFVRLLSPVNVVILRRRSV
jgi:hypothetical protein